MFAWTPYAIFALIKQFGDADLISPGIGVLPSIFAKTSICYNPIIYAGTNPQFRKAYNRFRGKTLTPRPMTVSTSAQANDAEVKEIIKIKLQTVNTNMDAIEPANNECDIEAIELKVINKGKSVTIQSP